MRAVPALNPTLPPPFFKRPRFPVCILFLLLSFAYKLNPYCACEADYANYANDPGLFFVLQINPRLPQWQGGREGWRRGVRGILSLFHNCMNFKYTVIRSSSAFTAGTGTIIIILELQGWLTVKRQAAFAPLLTHAGQMAKDAGFGNTLSLCVCVCVFFLKHLR